MNTNDPLFKQLISIVNTISVENFFEIRDLIKSSKMYNPKIMPSLGRLFKQEVINNNIPNVVIVTKKSNNHNVYKKINSTNSKEVIS